MSSPENNHILRVMQVDDDIEINLLMKQWFKDMPYEFSSYDDSRLFLTDIKKMKPDLCIIDVNMGIEGVGLKLVQAIRKVLGKFPPIILYSSLSDPTIIAHGLELGADDYIIKPSKKSEFLKKVTEHIKFDTNKEGKYTKYIPEKYQKLKLQVSAKILSIDEFGISIQSKELISKGTRLTLNSIFFSIDLDFKQPVVGTVISNWISPEDRLIGTYIEFDFNEDTNKTAVLRSWILKNKQGTK